MRLPPKIKIPSFERYDGTKDPRHHLRHYQSKMLQYWEYEEFIIQTIQDSLMGSALDWVMTLKAGDIPTSTDLSQKFLDQYRFCVETPPTLLELSTMEMKENQAFEAYASEWRGKAAKHIPLISEIQQVQLFHSTFKGVYYSHLLSHASSFFELIEAGKKLDMGIKLGRIKGLTKKKEEEALKKHNAGASRRTKDTTVSAVNSGRQSSQPISVDYTPTPQTYQTYAHPAHYVRPYQSQQAYPSAPPTVIYLPSPQQYAPSQAQQNKAPASRSPQPAQRAPALRVQQSSVAQSRPRKQYTNLPAPPSHIFQQLLAGNKIKTKALGHSFDPTEMIDARHISFNEVKQPNVRVNPLPDHGSGPEPSINMISICIVGEEEETQESPAPFVIEYVSAEVAVASAPFIVEVPAKEPYQDSRVPWTNGGEVANA
ncbi:uncharacterized protein LOC116205150 [Punica granatum]|uniref:Uncharacterized protein LOC116205150 n=1 Tax=Punica granatum TaxID=22663 RepID=A0A6P8DGC1_PUNGR|nr:uncharacterized protein LOC116205150 [Punica granatum]